MFDYFKYDDGFFVFEATDSDLTDSSENLTDANIVLAMKIYDGQVVDEDYGYLLVDHD